MSALSTSSPVDAHRIRAAMSRDFPLMIEQSSQESKCRKHDCQAFEGYMSCNMRLVGATSSAAQQHATDSARVNAPPAKRQRLALVTKSRINTVLADVSNANQSTQKREQLESQATHAHSTSNAAAALGHSSSLPHSAKTNNAHSQTFFVRIQAHQCSKHSAEFKFDFTAESDLHRLLRPHRHILQQQIKSQNIRDCHAYLCMIQRNTERLLQHQQSQHVAITSQQASLDSATLAKSSPALLSEIASQLENAGWNYISTVDDSLQQVTLKIVDSAQRKHELHLSLPDNYPTEPPRITASLPWSNDELVESFDWHASKTNQTISHIISCLDRLIQALQPWCNSLDDLNKHCRIISHAVRRQPNSVNYADTSIRLAITGDSSVLLEFDPVTLQCVSQQWLGRESQVSHLRHRLVSAIQRERERADESQQAQPSNQSSASANPRSDVHHGTIRAFLVASLLPFTFPSPLSAAELEANRELCGSTDESAKECAICYSFALDKDALQSQASESHLHSHSAPSAVCVPTILCSNPCCSRVYHLPCLREWQQSTPQFALLQHNSAHSMASSMQRSMQATEMRNRLRLGLKFRLGAQSITRTPNLLGGTDLSGPDDQQQQGECTYCQSALHTMRLQEQDEHAHVTSQPDSHSQEQIQAPLF